jgi:hypothetical protein
MKKCDCKLLVSLAARQGFKPLANSKSPPQKTEGERGGGGERVSVIHNGCSAPDAPKKLEVEKGREGEGEKEFL